MGAVTEDQMERHEIDVLLGTQLQEVLALDAPPDPDASFADDLHADSLDLVEVVEAVEAELARRGLAVRLPEDVLRSLTTVGGAARTIHDAVSTAAPGPRP